jgi:predicted  nucleic acid-binding Zn-ribbon protein
VCILLTTNNIKSPAKEEVIMSEQQAYEEQLETQIQELNTKIDQLHTKLESIETESSKSAIQSSLEDLQNRKQDLEEKLQELKNSTGSAWDELRTGVEKAFHDVASAVENALGKFK